MKKIINLLWLMAILFVPYYLQAQFYPSTLRVPVRFYDFHSNGSCPDFNPGRPGVDYTDPEPGNFVIGMVQDTLGPNGVPLRGSVCDVSYYIHKWFVPWTSGDFTRPVYNKPAGTLNRIETVSWDTSYKNMPYDTFLTFEYIPGSNGQYRFWKNYANGGFWPLDNRLFGNERTLNWNGQYLQNHNYSFSMHVRWLFQYRRGLFFEFEGDDDVWVFVNRKLVLDLGGLHQVAHGSFSLDTMATRLGLEEGKSYYFDLFYCERQAEASDILITSNIISASPVGLNMTTIPASDTIMAGDSMQIFAKVRDDTGAFRPEYSRLIKWSLEAFPPSNDLRSSLKTQQDSNNVFYAVEAYKTYLVIAKFDEDPVHPERVLLDTVIVYVKPANPDHLVIEASPDSTISLNADNPLNLLTFTGDMNKDSAYAILRDRFGNFYSHATNAQWSVRDAAVVSVVPRRTQLGEGEITRLSATNASTYVYAEQNGMKDTLQVVLTNVNYSRINIVVRQNIQDSITSLQMRTDQDTVLYAKGLRADGSGIWDDIMVNWGVTSGLTFNNSPPSSAISWRFRPTTTGTGKIYIIYGSLRDTISATFLPGLPSSMALYPKQGTPNVEGNYAYGPVSNVTAGVGFPIYAKIFSSNNEWLSSYEGSGAPISWTITELTGATNSGTLNTYSGSIVTFTGTKAYQTVRVTATFSGGINASIILNILPGPATKLVIEPDTFARASYPNDPLGTHRVQSVTIGGTSTQTSVYAVLRDQFGNFVSFSTPTNYTSRDTNIVAVSNGIVSYGEGICLRKASQGQVYVVAQDGVNTSLTDSVLVVLSNVYYTALRIVVNDSTPLLNHRLVMSVDQDTMLKVQGLRSDGAGWENVLAQWDALGNLKTVTSAPGAASFWEVYPSDTGSGYIKVTMGSATPDSISVIFVAGAPKYIKLYPLEGPPYGNNMQYPDPSWQMVDTAGEPLQVVAKVFDRVGTWLSQYELSSAPISWSVYEFPQNRNTPTGTLNPTSGYKTTYTPTKAYNIVYIIARFLEGGVDAKDTITIRVVPSAANHLVIESTPDSLASLNSDNPVASLTFTQTMLKDSVYAILRDAYGNFVGYASLAQWTSLNNLIATVSSARAALGEGEIVRQTRENASTYIVASQGGMTDSVLVNFIGVGYSRIEIVLRGGVSIDTLRMRTDQDTTLFARGLRADGSNQWDDLPVIWGNSSGLAFNNPAPSNASLWSFRPVNPDTGTIFIVYGTGQQQLRDEIVVMFNYGNPDTLVLYPKEGQPGVNNNDPYPKELTVTAGVPLSLTAKLFFKQTWLSGYERANAPFTWTITELTGASGSATLDRYNGFQTTFTGYKAYQKVRVTATFNEAGITLINSIVITIQPAAAAKLVIEPDTLGRTAFPNDLNGTHRALSVSILGSDTSVSVYAVLRDQFGNFVGFSNPTQWQSRDIASADIRSGNAVYGEGIAVRRTNTGQAWIVATDGNNSSFKDSVLVVLSNIYYTQLRIVVRDTVKISTLSMTIDDDTTISVQGLRSDGLGWEKVMASWQATSQLKTATVAPGASANWTIVPIDTGRGYIKVTLGNAKPDSIIVQFLRGKPNSIVLYNADGDPKNLTSYPNPTTIIQDTAGVSLAVVAKIFDKAGIWLNSYERSTAPVKWKIEELPDNKDIPTGSTSPDSGYKTTLTPVRANNTILLIAEFNESGVILRDSIKVTVVAGAPHHLVIENDPRRETSPHKDNPLDTVEIPSSEKYAVIYAVIRDKYQNFIEASQHTQWISLDSAVVTATDGQKSLGQGVVTRIDPSPRDRAKIVAISLDYAGLSDTTTAKVLNYYYVALRIVSGTSATQITSLSMNTNQDTTLRVMGQRSTDGGWEYVSAKWENSSGLNIIPQAPTSAQSWTFSPAAPGSGIIRVTLGTDTVTTKPAYVNVNFTVGPPVSIQMQILTPAQQRIAGDTIVAVIQIKNKDGLVPGLWCDSTTYLNTLGTGGGGRPNPTVDGVNMGTSMYECFNDGIDTVKFVLYYAPANKDSMEKIVVTLKNLSASSEPFVMYPGALSRIALEGYDEKEIDSVYLTYPTGSKLIIATGYDAYGNKRGPESSNWSVSGTLHPIENSKNVSRIFYESGSVRYDEQGYIYAEAQTPSGSTVKDSVKVTIAGRPTNLTSITTKDVNGNGYLDQLILKFDKKIDWPDSGVNFTFSGSITDPITQEVVTYKLKVDSVVGIGGTSNDSVFIAYLSEPKQGDALYNYPQTGWTPKVTIAGLSGVAPITNVTSQDGAGPVIWSVTKTIYSPSERDQDKITIVFSEPIGTNGNDFNLSLSPASVLRVWEKTTITLPDGTTKDTLIEVTDMFFGINDFYQIEKNISVVFYMTNQKDLTSRNYINIIADSISKGLSDKQIPPNVPVVQNKTVQVIVKSMPVREILVAPNPTSPIFTREKPGEINLVHQPNARRWIREDGAGVLLTFKITPATNQKITGCLKIFDVIGNPVAVVDSLNSSKGIVLPNWVSGDTSAYDFDIYWNGSNSKKQKCAAGVYRAVLILKYTDQTTNKSTYSKLWGTVGIQRER